MSSRAAPILASSPGKSRKHHHHHQQQREDRDLELTDVRYSATVVDSTPTADSVVSPAGGSGSAIPMVSLAGNDSNDEKRDMLHSARSADGSSGNIPSRPAQFLLTPPSASGDAKPPSQPPTPSASDDRIPKFLTAASKRDLKAMTFHMEGGLNPGGADYDKRTALHLASAEGHSDAVKLLIDAGVNVNAMDRFGCTPLDDALRHGRDDVALLLREKGGRVGDQEKHASKLIHAAYTNNLEEAARLLQNGVSVNTTDYDRRTPLHLAVAERHADMVRLLLQYNADPHVEDRWGFTPVAEAKRYAQRTGVDNILPLFAAVSAELESHASLLSPFVLLFSFWEVVMCVLFGLFVNYADSAGGGVTADSGWDAMTHVYPLYQDVHVMIYVGFGFLMCFLRKNGYMSVGITFLVGAFCIQWFILTSGFWAGALSGTFDYIYVDIPLLARADFCAGAVLITYGVILGKVSPIQMLCIALFETFLYALNERIGLRLHIADLGGSITIHMFGAFFGLTTSLVLTRRDISQSADNAANYHSDLFSMIGTLFLWLFWPSFNGALGVGNTQHRSVINTVLSIAASCVTAFLMSHLLRREAKFFMVDIQNATLAGGVAMGACADLLIHPGSAFALGIISGLASVLGFSVVQPMLERSLGLHDTCGVLNLHAIPSVIGAFASVIAASQASLSSYGADQLSVNFPARPGRSANTQALFQFYYILATLGISIVGGFFTAVVMKLDFFGTPQVEESFRDAKYFEVPSLETPYYFDQRGEISRGPGNTVDLPDAAGKAVLDASALIQKLESRVAILEGKLARTQQAGQEVTAVEKLFDRLLSKLDRKVD